MTTLHIRSATATTSRAGRCAGDPGRVRRLRVPLLRAGLPDRQSSSRSASATGSRFVFRNFPLTQMHPEAESAAETAEFAGAHGQFWEMHDALYENRSALGPELYLAAAQGFGLAGDELSEALRQQAFGLGIRSDFRGGLEAGERVRRAHR